MITMPATASTGIILFFAGAGAAEVAEPDGFPARRRPPELKPLSESPLPATMSAIASSPLLMPGSDLLRV